MTLPLRSAVLHTASTQVGVKERGANRVPYWSLKPEWNGSPWCATFVQWCLKQHGGWFDAPLPYYVPSMEQHARKHGLWLSKSATPRPGDLVVYGGDRAQHVGFVVGTASLGRIVTIEGNTSSGVFGSQANGDGVYRRTRTRSWVRGFIRMQYAPEPVAPAPAPKPKPVVKPKPKPVAARTLNRGDSGADVKRLQAGMRRAFPAYARIAADGKFGPATERAVREFQRRARLVVDGRVGPKTRAALARYGVRF